MAKQLGCSDVVVEDDQTTNLSEILLLEEDDGVQIFRTTDEQYAEELQFQEALMASSLASQMKAGSSSSPSTSTNISTENSKMQKLEMASSPSSSQFFCEICAEKKEAEDMFNKNNSSCACSFCSDCIVKHISMKVQQRSFVDGAVSCPGFDCHVDHALRFEACSSFLPKLVTERWDEALCESALLEFDKFYCPFNDCSAMMINEEEQVNVVMRECECPMCHRLFCARCYVPWHSGVECEEFQRLNEDERGKEDLMVKELAKDNKWKRCPHCKFYVEKTQGCLHITCRCQFQFCYGCGSEWTLNHGGCQRD